MSALIVSFRRLNTVPLFNDVKGNGRWEKRGGEGRVSISSAHMGRK